MTQALSLYDVLVNLRGQVVSGINRTHGSMFFLELGQMVVREEGKQSHGQWHFLFELCHWRIASSEELLVGSDDEQSFIDEAFRSTAFGAVERAAVSGALGDLCVSFSSGLTLSTLTTSAKAVAEDWTQWRLYCPDQNVWVVDGRGHLVRRNLHESRI